MKTAVDKEFKRRESVQMREVDKDFSGFLGEREGQDVGRPVFAPIDSVEPAGKNVFAENEREFIVLSKNGVLDLIGGEVC